MIKSKKGKKIIVNITITSVIFICIFLGIYFKQVKDKKFEQSEKTVVLENKQAKKEILENKKAEVQSKINGLENKLNETYMILVNKDNKLGAKDIPDNLIKSSIAFLSNIETRNLDETVANAAKHMFDDANKEGITLLGASGYRAYEVQNRIYKEKVRQVGVAKAEKCLAPPGASEHQTGYAIDIVSNEYNRLDEGFENSKAFSWLIENSKNYGFILRYPKDKEYITKYEYEPWHYRYVGIENATKIMNEKLSLEEYVEKTRQEICNLQDELD